MSDTITEILANYTVLELQAILDMKKKQDDQEIQVNIKTTEKRRNDIKSRLGIATKELLKCETELSKCEEELSVLKNTLSTTKPTTKPTTKSKPISTPLHNMQSCWYKDESEKVENIKKVEKTNKPVSKKVEKLATKNFENLVSIQYISYSDYIKMNNMEKKEFSTNLIYDNVSDAYYIPVTLGKEIVELSLKKQNTTTPGSHTKSLSNVYETYGNNNYSHNYSRSDPTQVRTIIGQVSFDNKYPLSVPFNNNESTGIITNIRNAEPQQASYASDISAHFLYGSMCIALMIKQNHKWAGQLLKTHYGNI